MTQMPKVVYLDVVGCPENRYDVGQLRAFLENRGVKITTNPKEADTLIVNTCGLTQMNENISQEMIQKIKEKASPNSRLIVSGCLPKINPEALRGFKDTLIIPGPIVDSLPWVCEPARDLDLDFSPWTYPQRLIMEPEKIWQLKKGTLWILDRLLYRWSGVCPPHRSRYYIKIASGCNRHCTYCAIRISRGPLRSQPVQWVVDRLRDGVAAGYREINLIGTNVSAYGQDTGTTLPALLRTLLEVDDSFRLYLRNLEPDDVLHYLDEFTQILKTGRIVYLELQLQAGNDRILKLMNRGYTVEQFSECIWAIKRAYPKINIRSQVMVGYPTETEEEFQETLKLVSKLPFTYVEPFRFSARPGTAAARLQGQLDRKVAKARYHRLKKRLMRSHLGAKLKFATSFCLHTVFSPQRLKQRASTQ